MLVDTIEKAAGTHKESREEFCWHLEARGFL